MEISIRDEKEKWLRECYEGCVESRTIKSGAHGSLRLTKFGGLFN